MSRTRLALLLSVLLTGCVSADRLARSIPSSAPTIAADRVNLWPLVYASDDLLTILWPIYDQDDAGFALRPLLTKDGTSWEVVPPLSYFDTASGNWYVLLAYRFGGSHGLFPLYDRGFLNNVGPVWWTEDADGQTERGGLFPLALLGPELNYVGLAWWVLDDGKVDAFGLFPVCHFGPELNFFIPAYWTKGPTGEVDSFGVFPLLWSDGDRGHVGPAYWSKDSMGLFPLAHVGKHFSFVGPAFWKYDADGEFDFGGLFPLATFTPKLNHVGPVYWYYDENGVATFTGLFPIANFGPWFNHVGPVFWTRDDDGAIEHRGLFPIAWSGPDLGYVGPAFWTRDTDGAVDGGGLFPLVTLTDTFNNIGPYLWRRHEDGALQFSTLPPLFYYGEGGDDSTLLLTPLGAKGWDAGGEPTFTNLLGLVYHYQRLPDGYFTFVTPFYSRLESARESRWHVWPIVGRGVTRDDEGAPNRYTTDLLGGWIHHEGLDGTDRFRMWPLVSYRSPEGGPPGWSDWLSLYAHKTTPDGGVNLSVLSPLTFHYESSAEGTAWHGPLGTVSYEKKAEESEFSLLWYFYRQKTEGTETRRDLFPFITWDSGEKRSGFSFLWRLFRYERKGDAVGGHVLFIPWGDSD